MQMVREALLASRTYGVLVGTVKAGRLNPGGNSPHYEIWIDAGVNYRIAVNVRSVDASEVLVHYDPAYASPTKRNLPGLAAGPHGFTALVTGAGGAGLDYVRDGLFPIADMHAIPPDGMGVTLQNLLDGQFSERSRTRAPSRSPSATDLRIRVPTQLSAFRPRTAFTTST